MRDIFDTDSDCFNMKEGYQFQIVGLGYSYPNGHRALEGIAFEVRRGEKLALIGPNGSGKSTLLLLLAGLLPGGRREGEIRRAEGSGNPAFLFQNPDDQMIASTVEDDVGFALLREGLALEEVRVRVGEILRRVHLGGYESRSPLELSFGEKKRAGLAGCLIAYPETIFLDEPALGLDPREVGGLLDILRPLEVTTVFASMDFDLVSGLADRVIILDRGRIAASGPPGEILSDRGLLREHGLTLTVQEKYIELTMDR